jgi:hypothetical protein
MQMAARGRTSQQSSCGGFQPLSHTGEYQIFFSEYVIICKYSAGWIRILPSKSKKIKRNFFFEERCKFTYRKKINKTNKKKFLFFVGISRVTDKKSRIRIRIRILRSVHQEDGNVGIFRK